MLDPRWTITNTPIWTEGFLNKYKVEDEVAFFQIGQYEDEEFEVFEIGKEFTSEMSNWPTKETKSIFRFNGIYLELG